MQLDPQQIAQIMGQARDVAPSAGGAKTPKLETTGQHLVEITKVSAHPATLSSAMLYTVEFRVIETSAPDVQVGSVFARTRDFGDRLYGLPEVLQIICAAIGIDSTTNKGQAEFREKQDEIYEAAGEATTEEQPLRGVTLTLKTQTKTSKSSGRDFTVHTWLPA